MRYKLQFIAKVRLVECAISSKSDSFIIGLWHTKNLAFFFI